jgi:uncharacterized protein YegL
MAFRKKGRPAPPAPATDDRERLSDDLVKLLRTTAGEDLLPDRAPTPEGNFTPRAVLVVVQDVSGSVTPFAADVEGSWETLAATLRRDTLTAVSVEVGTVFCNDRLASLPFTPAAEFEAPALEFGGRTPLGAAIELALDQLTARLRELAAEGIPVTKKGIAIICDGYPTDDTRRAIERLHEFEAKERLNVFPFAVGEASIEFLNRLSRRTKAVHAKGNDYQAIYSWLAALVSRYSRSRPGEAVENPPLPPGFTVSL